MNAGDLPRPAKGSASLLRLFGEIERIIVLSTGFVLLPIEVPGPDLARELGERFTAGGHPTTLLEPLYDEAWAKLASVLTRTRPSPEGIVMVIGGRDLSRGLDLGLHLVNQSRDTIARRLGRPLLWCGPRPFLERTMDEAPDFWSIRAVERKLAPGAPPARSAPEQAPMPLPSPAGRAAPAAAPAPPPQAAPGLEAMRREIAPSLHPDPSTRLELIERELSGNVLNAARLSRPVIEELLARDDAGAAEALLARTFPPIKDLSDPVRSDLAILQAKIQHRRGMFGDAIATLGEVLADPATRVDQRVTAQLALADIHRARGDAAHAEELYQEALKSARATQDGSAEARALAGLGSLLLHANPLDAAALAMLEEGHALAQKLGDPDLRSLIRDALAKSYSAAYDERRARGLLE